jgi:hypothetical protein
VVRLCDVASASILSLLKSQTEQLRVVLSAFRAGGDSLTITMQPTFEVEINNGRVASYSVFTPAILDGMPCEVICFAHQGLEIRSAPQLQTGMRGAVRTCNLNS